MNEFSNMMDYLGKLLLERNLGAQYNDLRIPALLFMDDIAVLENNKDRLINSLDIMETFRKKIKLEFSDTKWQILIINKDKLDEHITWKIGNMELPITEQYTYLGQVIHQSGTIKQHLKLKQTKSTALVRNITMSE